MGVYHIAVVFCTTLAGQPTECIEAYRVRDRHTGEVAVFANGTDCNAASFFVRDAHRRALAETHQRDRVHVQTPCLYDAKGEKP